VRRAPWSQDGGHDVLAEFGHYYDPALIAALNRPEFAGGSNS